MISDMEQEKYLISNTSPYRRPRSPVRAVSSLSEARGVSSLSRGHSMETKGERDKDVERITSKYSSSSPVGGPVFLSKKMKELTEKQQQRSSPMTTTSSVQRQSSVDSRQRSSPVQTSYSTSREGARPEQRSTRSFLDELSSKRMPEGGLSSPTDSFIDRMIISAQQDIVTPTDFGLSRHSSIVSIPTKHKDEQLHDYHSLPPSRLHQTDNMKTFESKYLTSKARSPVKDYNQHLHDKMFSSMSGYVSSPMKTYDQSQRMNGKDRASSYHDIRDPEDHYPPPTKTRTRHSTLPYGVGSADLTAAKFDMDMNNIMRELEVTGFFSQSRHSMKSGYLPSSVSSAVSTPAVFTSNPLSLPLDMTRDMATSGGNVSPSHTHVSHATLSRPATAFADNQPLVVLRKQDLDDFLREQSVSRLESRMDNNEMSSYSAAQSRCVTPAPSVRSTGARDSATGWVKKKTNLSQSEVDYKKLALVNDDLLKMWEESQAENTKLRLELSGVRSELEQSKHQLENAEKRVIKNNAVTDQEKREKKIVVKKLAEMEEELKLLALSENLTDQTLDQLKSDNSRLRDENTALLRVIAKMSK